MNSENFDVIIVGSGVGGLAAAICLSKYGKKVLVLEQHYVPGGWSHSFMINQHKFSPGVHYVGQVGENQTTNKMYCDLGIANDLVFFRLNKDGYEHCIVGDKRFDFPEGLENLKEKLSNQFPKESLKIRKYLDRVELVNHQIQLMPTFRTFWQKITAPFKTKYVGKYAFFSLKKVIGWYFKDPLLKAYLNIQCGDHGLPPNKASFLVHSSVMTHYFNGGYYPAGGGGGIVKAMTKKIKEQGGEVRVRAKVDKIIIENNHAQGVVLDNGQKIFAKTVISNADPTVTYKNLIGEDHLSKNLLRKLKKTNYSVTSFILFLSLEMDLSATDIDSGNYWWVKDERLDDHFNEMMKGDVLKGEHFPAIFLSCTTLKDPASFNGKHHNFEVITYVSYDCMKPFNGLKDYHNSDYERFKEKIKSKMLNNVEMIIPGAKKNINFAELGTPKTNEYYINATKGNVYGTEKTLSNIGPFAFQNKSKIKGLYLCGSSTLSHGVSGATSSGINTAAQILGYHPDDLLSPDENQKIRIYDADDPESWPEWVFTKRNTKAKKM